MKPVRCLLVNHSPVDGSGTGVYVAAVAESLRRESISPALLTPGVEDGFVRKGDIDVFTFELRLPGRRPGEFPTFTGHPTSGLRYADLTDVQVAEYRAQLRRALRRTIDRVRPDLVHAQHLFHVASAAADFLPTIVTCHGSELHFHMAHPHRSVLVEAAGKAAAVVYVSAYVASVGRGLLSVGPRTEVVPNGYDPRVFWPGAPRPARRAPRLAAVGRLVWYKRFDVILEALRSLEGDPSRPELVVVGDGPERLQLERQAAGLSGVRFCGFLAPPAVGDIFRDVDATVVPSEREPFGLVALESLACGTPVIASASGALPELIDRDVGALVDTWDPAHWAEAIRSTLERFAAEPRPLATALTRAAGADWTRTARRLAVLYQAVLGRRRIDPTEVAV